MRCMWDTLETVLGLKDERDLWWWTVRQTHELLWRAPDKVKPYPGAVEGLRAIYERAGVFFTTARPYPPYDEICTSLTDAIGEWLHRWFGLKDEVVIVGSTEIPKTEAIKGAMEIAYVEPRNAVVVDDNPEVQKWALEKGFRAVLSLAKPWAHQFPEGVVTAESWEELAEKALEVFK